jgi:antitoxin HicB
VKPFPYRVVVGWSDEDEAFVARMPALPGAGGDGKTEQGAIDAAKAAAASVLEVMRVHGDPIPLSDLGERKYSGQLRLRLPSSLHRTLTETADVEGISLNQLMVVYLTAEHTRRSTER